MSWAQGKRINCKRKRMKEIQFSLPIQLFLADAVAVAFFPCFVNERHLLLCTRQLKSNDSYWFDSLCSCAAGPKLQWLFILAPFLLSFKRAKKKAKITKNFHEAENSDKDTKNSRPLIHKAKKDRENIKISFCEHFFLVLSASPVKGLINQR